MKQTPEPNARYIGGPLDMLNFFSTKSQFTQNRQTLSLSQMLYKKHIPLSYRPRGVFVTNVLKGVVERAKQNYQHHEATSSPQAYNIPREYSNQEPTPHRRYEESSSTNKL